MIETKILLSDLASILPSMTPLEVNRRGEALGRLVIKALEEIGVDVLKAFILEMKIVHVKN